MALRSFFGEMFFRLLKTTVQAVVAASLIGDAMHRSRAHFEKRAAQCTFQASVVHGEAGLAGVQAERLFAEL